MPGQKPTETKPEVKHTLLDDIQAIIVGCMLISFGVTVFSHKSFLIVGTAGISFLTQYATSLSFGKVFYCESSLLHFCH